MYVQVYVGMSLLLVCVHYVSIWSVLLSCVQYVQVSLHFSEAECLPLLRNSLKLVVCLQVLLVAAPCQVTAWE